VNILIRLLTNKVIAGLLLKPMLKIHTMSYKLSGLLASTVHNNVHPKHSILLYKEWFLDNISEGDVVLDVGCNTGMMPFMMSNKSKFVYGIEIEKKHIEVAKKSSRKKDNIEYICADATTYDYTYCKPIDTVTLSNVLEHVEFRTDFLKKLITQVCWANNGNKKILIRVPMIDRDWIAVYKKEIALEYRLDNTHFIEYTYDSFLTELIESGIEIKSYHIKFGEIYAVCRVT
jgi:2-polyprenyl-3-methyl-5-hydroxy-6-metoxy-1,4-benzoquinol methylase